MKKILLSIFITILISSCAAPSVPPQPIMQIVSSYDAKELEWFFSPKISRSNVLGIIEGSAFAKTKGGDVKSCAGSSVAAIPKSTYSQERIETLYGNGETGTNGIYGSPANFRFFIKIEEPDLGYSNARRETQCDVDGRFKFVALPPGEYYIITRIIWEAGNRLQGGDIMKKVKLEDGEVKTIVVTP